MAQKKKQMNWLKKYGWVLAGFLLFAVIFGRWAKQSGYLSILNEIAMPALTQEGLEKKYFSSDVMRFSIRVPIDSLVDERFGTVNINLVGGEIFIGFVGTNFDNLISHLSDPRNDVLSRLEGVEKLSTNGAESISGFNGEEKSYYIFVDNKVYFLSTDSPALYDELDAVAQSFRYTGN